MVTITIMAGCRDLKSNGLKMWRANPGWSVIGRSPDYGNQYTDTGLQAGATYWYRVRAYNWIGAGEFSAPVGGTIIAPRAPYSVTALIGTTNTVEVKWEAASPGDQTGYFLERAADAGGVPGTWSQITVISNFYGYYRDTNITAFTTNWYRVRSFNVVGISPYSLACQIAITPRLRPTMCLPPRLRTRSGSRGEVPITIMVRWPVTNSNALRRWWGSGAWSQIATKSSVYQTDHTDPNLPANATFWYRVCVTTGLADGSGPRPRRPPSPPGAAE